MQSRCAGRLSKSCPPPFRSNVGGPWPFVSLHLLEAYRLCVAFGSKFCFAVVSSLAALIQGRSKIMPGCQQHPCSEIEITAKVLSSEEEFSVQTDLTAARLLSGVRLLWKQAIVLAPACCLDVFVLGALGFR